MEHHPIESGRADELAAVLSDARRRTVLEYLRETPAETVPLDELARVLAGRDATGPGDAGPGAAGDEPRLLLHHVTLPKLAAAGVLEYDPRAHTVTCPDAEALETLLEEARRLDDRLE